jgi:3-phosphoshikimate 1-carboxyvinyltransferase
MEITIDGGVKLRGQLRMPGDKSIAHRALMFGALAEGRQIIHGLPGSADVASTARCLSALGFEITTRADGTVVVGNGGGGVATGCLLDAGNSGTSARLLAGLTAGRRLSCTIDGDDSLRRRPMNRIVAPLRLMGASISAAGDGMLPLTIDATDLTGIDYRMPVASAQVKSAVLLAGLGASGVTTVRETDVSRNHTEVMLRAMGVDVSLETTTRETAVSVTGGANLVGVEMDVPGDISSAAFFLAAAAIVPKAELRLQHVGVNPTRTGIISVLEQMGATITVENARESGGEPVADLVARCSKLKGIEIGGALIPRLIDELPVLAVVASQAEGETIVRDATELRHKESDRIATTVSNLVRLGVDITERPDGFVVKGPCRLSGARVDACGDHRISMAMAVAALAASGSTVIENYEVVTISYPEFFSDLERLTV